MISTIKATIELVRQDLIDMGLDIEGDKATCIINKGAISFLYPSYDDGKRVLGTKIHVFGGESIWCYEDFDTIKSRLENND